MQEFAIDYPIFAFSHCRDVVTEVSRGGGFGVLGAVRMQPDQLEEELSWIDEHGQGKPYGIDVIIPAKYERLPNGLDATADANRSLHELIPPAYWEFVEGTLRELDVPPLPRVPERSVGAAVDLGFVLA